MMTARTDQSLLDELDTLEFRLRRTNDESGLRRILVQLNEIRNESQNKSQLVRARYFFLRGMLYVKAGRNHQISFLGASGETLIYALELFIDSDSAIKGAAHEDGWSKDLKTLQQRCAYEAIVIVTVLKDWGRDIASLQWPDTNSLDAHTQRKVQAAIRHGHMLPSRF